MLKRSLVLLNKLTQEQKEQTWKETISGSQAWALANEPYRLIREKLGLEPIHPTKYAFFETETGQKLTEVARLNGHLYEPTVVQELKRDHPELDYVYADNTFKLCLFTEEGTKFEAAKITCTPDLYIKGDKPNTFKLVADIKNTKYWKDEEVLKEKYYWQALHNCYVLNCKEFVLYAKCETRQSPAEYVWVFSDEQFQMWENVLVGFFNNIVLNKPDAYDELYEQKKVKEEQEKLTGKTLKFKDPVEREADAAERMLLENLFEAKAKMAELKSDIEDMESAYKENFDNITVTFGNKVFVQQAIETKGTIDYAEVCKAYNISKTELEKYRKPATISRRISFKEGGE